MGDQGLQEPTYKTMDDKKNLAFKVDQCLARHHRQILGRDPDAGHQGPGAGAFFRRRQRRGEELPDRLPARRADRRAGRDRHRRCAAVRRRQGDHVVGINFPFVDIGGYNQQLGLNHFDLLIDWGWFYFITKPMFLALDFLFTLVGNFGVAILLVTVLRQGAVLPARQQVLRLDGEDEAAAAADGGDPRALHRRQGEAAAGDDGALQAARRSIRSPAACRS